jgi:nucleotide-binding universal stress UspA family protein
MTKPVVFGYDGSAISNLAMEWAVQAAADRGIPLEIVVCWQVPPVSFGSGMGMPLESELVEELTADAESLLAAGLDKARGMAPDLDVRGELLVAGPAAALVERSKDAALVVVGSHGKGGFSGLLLGSVSRQVSTHAKCPVAVIRESAKSAAKEVVVGVDGSASALKALDWAFDHASRTGQRLRVLHAWEVPPITAITSTPTISAQEVMQDLKGAEARATAEVLAGHRETYPDVDVVQEVVRGSPVAEIARVSQDSVLVVVGSRGRGGFLGLLLGSVSHGVVHHAHCPVVVVH